MSYLVCATDEAIKHVGGRCVCGIRGHKLLTTALRCQTKANRQRFREGKLKEPPPKLWLINSGEVPTIWTGRAYLPA